MTDIIGENVSLGDLTKLKVPDLKKLLKARGLSITGNKNELVERLQLAFDQGSPLDNTSEILDDDEVLAEVEALGDEMNDSRDEVALKPALKRKGPTQEVDKSVASKKVTLNRTPTVVSEKENLESDEVVVKALPDSTETKKPVEKISMLTAKERLELRANRFGTQTAVTTDVKKEARAARFGVQPSQSTTSNLDALKKRAERFGVTTAAPLSKLELDEKLKKRQERFGIVEPLTKNSTKNVKKKIVVTSKSVSAPITDEKRKQRAERFKLTL